MLIERCCVHRQMVYDGVSVEEMLTVADREVLCAQADVWGGPDVGGLHADHGARSAATL